MPKQARQEATRRIGERIRQRRLALDYQQKELAQKLGVTSATVSQWERGDTRPKGEHLVALTKILDVTSTWIITGEHGRRNSTEHAHLQALPILRTQDISEDWSATPGLRGVGTRVTAADSGPDGLCIICPDDAMTNPASDKSVPPEAMLILNVSRKWRSQDFVVANTRRAGPVFRRIINDGSRVFLRALNEGYADIPFENDDSVLGVVVRAEIDLN